MIEHTVLPSSALGTTAEVAEPGNRHVVGLSMLQAIAVGVVVAAMLLIARPGSLVGPLSAGLTATCLSGIMLAVANLHRLHNGT
jgi:hypothetical protein